MKSKDARKLNEQDMEKKMKDMNAQLVQLKAQAATGTPPENPGKIRQIKRTLARLKTILKEKEFHSSAQTKKSTETNK